VKEGEKSRKMVSEQLIAQVNRDADIVARLKG